MANILNLAFSGLCILMATCLHFLLKRRNVKLESYARQDMAEVNTFRGTKAIAYSSSLQCHPDYRFVL